MKSLPKVLKSPVDYKPGDIVLIRVPFTDFGGAKIRPALIIQVHMKDALIAPVSTTVNIERDDVLLADNVYAGKPLPVQSCVRYRKMLTVEESLIMRRFTSLHGSLLKEIKKKIAAFVLQ